MRLRREHRTFPRSLHAKPPKQKPIASVDLIGKSGALRYVLNVFISCSYSFQCIFYSVQFGHPMKPQPSQ